jgi:hypothetical protein
LIDIKNVKDLHDTFLHTQELFNQERNESMMPARHKQKLYGETSLKDELLGNGESSFNKNENKT